MDRPGPELPVLIGQTGEFLGQRWAIAANLVIGREAGTDIVIPDRQISRYHARLTSLSNGVLLEDLGSKNGTFINGKQVEEPVILTDGDVVQVAFVASFLFLSSDATVPLGGVELPLPSGERRGKLRLDTKSRRVWIGEQEVLPALSVPQFRLLQTLYEQSGKVVPREDLVNIIWSNQEAVGVSEEAFDALVRRLRDRLASIDPSHAYIITIRGHGLRMDNPR